MARAHDNGVTLKTPGGEYPIRGGQRFRRAALAWSYIAYNRQRWNRSNEARADLSHRCLTLLEEFGVDEDVLSYLAAEPIIEITIPYDEGDDSAQIMPWEYVIGEALTYWEATPLIVRHLLMRDQRRGKGRTSRRRRSRPLVVIGARELLEPQYSFESELELIARLLPKTAQENENYDLTIDEVEEIVRSKSPDIIHLGGVDNHFGVELFEHLDRTQLDGMIFSDGYGDIETVDFVRLAEVLTQGRSKPSVVVFNVYHSAPRLAARTVALGAGTALGFQDTYDDLSAERFLGQFYRTWERSNGDVLESAYVAFQSLKQSTANLVGSGVVLWSDRSLLSGDVEAMITAADKITGKNAEKQLPPTTFQSRDDARANLPIVVEPLKCLNYALLHNRESMFEAFELRNLVEEHTAADVKVEVELLAGPERLRYSANLQIGNAPISLSNQVFVPLTSALSRSLTESIRAGLRVRLSVGEHLGIHEQTHRVTLLPVNEWVDDDFSRQWLPSFIFPLDPAVKTIVSAANQYLAYLTDSVSSGFSGYQVLEGVTKGSDEEEEATDLLDAQIEAIWSALVYSLPLNYINPPPTFTVLSQRLRSPSDVLNSGHGTCIDLTLLLAAAFEYVEIYPVVFLLEGHAFPGYWRSHDAWMNFINMAYVEGLGVRGIEQLLLARRGQPQTHAWLFPNLYYKEIVAQLEAGNLVPLESVWLTNRSKFADAQDAGWENMATPGEFHSMIDIRLARECDVTPLPKLEN